MDSKPRGSPETAVLFVCLGNICRSPLAEGVFRHLVQSDGLKHRFHIDSAGTGAWHVGEAPDGRATVVAARHGVELHGQARQIQTADLHRFDFIIVMDRDNLDNVERLAEGSGSAAQIRLLREWDPQSNGDREVPDPYYGGPGGFENVYQMVRRSCQNLLADLKGNAASH